MHIKITDADSHLQIWSASESNGTPDADPCHIGTTAC